jgi:hypothetical protein
MKEENLKKNEGKRLEEHAPLRSDLVLIKQLQIALKIKMLDYVGGCRSLLNFERVGVVLELDHNIGPRNS